MHDRIERMNDKMLQSSEEINEPLSKISKEKKASAVDQKNISNKKTKENKKR